MSDPNLELLAVNSLSSVSEDAYLSCTRYNRRISLFIPAAFKEIQHVGAEGAPLRGRRAREHSIRRDETVRTIPHDPKISVRDRAVHLKRNRDREERIPIAVNNERPGGDRRHEGLREVHVIVTVGKAPEDSMQLTDLLGASLPMNFLQLRHVFGRDIVIDRNFTHDRTSFFRIIDRRRHQDHCLHLVRLERSQMNEGHAAGAVPDPRYLLEAQMIQKRKNIQSGLTVRESAGRIGRATMAPEIRHDQAK